MLCFHFLKECSQFRKFWEETVFGFLLWRINTFAPPTLTHHNKRCKSTKLHLLPKYSKAHAKAILSYMAAWYALPEPGCSQTHSQPDISMVVVMFLFSLTTCYTNIKLADKAHLLYASSNSSTTRRCAVLTLSLPSCSLFSHQCLGKWEAQRLDGVPDSHITVNFNWQCFVIWTARNIPRLSGSRTRDENMYLPPLLRLRKHHDLPIHI